MTEEALCEAGPVSEGLARQQQQTEVWIGLHEVPHRGQVGSLVPEHCRVCVVGTNVDAVTRVWRCDEGCTLFPTVAL